VAMVVVTVVNNNHVTGLMLMIVMTMTPFYHSRPFE